ncbi:hypothetical protein N431DRAFT_26723 [Stipitochalara longipes BDJ]|nr:hypothetical protein N431DRAFT_26723 [Stipitochalara longipes BDJ]
MSKRMTSRGGREILDLILHLEDQLFSPVSLPYQALHALRMDHHHHIMPHPHIMPRRPQPRQAAEDQLLPALPMFPDQGLGGDPLVREPYLGPGRRPGDANAPNFDQYFDDIIGDIGILQWGNGFPLPPPPPALGAAPPAAAARPLNQRVKSFNDFLMRRPGNIGDQLAVDQDMDWRNIAALPRPLADRRAAADLNRQGDELREFATLREKLAQRMRLRREPLEVQEAKDVPEALKERLAQAAAAREQTIKEQIRQARVERELILPNFVFPGDLQPPAGDILGAAGGNAVADIEAREAGRRRLEDQVNKAAVHLRSARLREAARNDGRNKEDRRRRARQNKLQALLDDTEDSGGLGPDEDVDEHMDFLHELVGTLPRPANPNTVKKVESHGPNEPLDNLAASVRWPRRPGVPRARSQADLLPSRIPQPAAALRQQQILDHEERRIERSQLMARLRRDQEDDEVATARRLAMLRQNKAPAAGPARAAIIDLLSSPETKKKVDQENLSDLEAGPESGEGEEWGAPVNPKAARPRRRLAVLRPYDIPAAGPARQALIDPLSTLETKKKVDLLDDLSDPDAFPESEDEEDYWL